MSNEAIGELVERLRKREHYVLMGPAYLMRTCEEAATALASQEAEIAELRKALKPFAEFWRTNCGELSQHHSYESIVTAKLPWGTFIDADAALARTRQWRAK